MDNRRGGLPPAVGGVSLLTAFAVLCLTVFALLSLATVRADVRLAEAAVRTVTDYYAADCRAQEVQPASGPGSGLRRRPGTGTSTVTRARSRIPGSCQWKCWSEGTGATRSCAGRQFPRSCGRRTTAWSCGTARRFERRPLWNCWSV